MAEIKGKIVTCDRCGKNIFLKCTGEGEADGGFTRWNKFEPMPAGWDEVAVPKDAPTKSGNAYNGYILACPTCKALWRETIYEHFLNGTKYYKPGSGEKDGN